MNKPDVRCIALAAAIALGSAPAMAQSGLTLYGGLDLSVQYKTNVDKAGGHSFTVGDSNAPDIADGGQGALTGSHWGLKGREQLSARTSAIFQVESGIVLGTGMSDQQGQLFGRQAFVGLDDQELGRLTFGRQLGIATSFAFDFDPLGVGNYQSNEWQIYIYGVRFDNSVMYAKTVGPWTVNAQYSFGEAQGRSAIGRTTGLDVRYAEGPVKLGGYVQRSVDANGRDSVTAGTGLIWNAGATTVFAAYSDTAHAPGFAMAANNSGQPLANTGLWINNTGNPWTRHDRLATLGVLYGFTPALNLTAGYMVDRVRHATAAGDGRMSTTYALLDYCLSKRTDVYVEIDYSTASGQAVSGGGVISAPGTLNGMGAGQRQTTGVSIGMRHFF